MTCIDCGKDSTGVRCWACSTLAQQRLAANLLALQDENIIRMRDVERLSLASMGRRLGVTPPAIQKRLTRARARQKILKEANGE